MALIDHVSKLNDAEFAALSPARVHAAQVVRRRRQAEANAMPKPPGRKPVKGRVKAPVKRRLKRGRP
jgi:hypothetical protein